MCDNLRCIKCGSMHHSTGNCMSGAQVEEYIAELTIKKREKQDTETT